MGATKDKLTGAVNTGVGRIKQGISHDTNDSRLEGDGMNQEVKGRFQHAIGTAKDMVGGALNRIASAVRRSGS